VPQGRGDGLTQGGGGAAEQRGEVAGHGLQRSLGNLHVSVNEHLDQEAWQPGAGEDMRVLLGGQFGVGDRLAKGSYVSEHCVTRRVACEDGAVEIVSPW
jgi:hypothetical protein